MPLQPIRKPKQTIRWRPNAHRTENVTVLAASPAAPSGVDATAGAAGTLNDATYIYRVTSVDGGLEGPVSVEVSAATTAGVGAGSVEITWEPVYGATSYNVYGRTGAIELLGNVTATTFVDDGSVTPDGAMPLLVNQANLRLPQRANATNVGLGPEVGDYQYRYSNPAV